MRRYVLVAALSFIVSGCDTPLGGVFSRDQSGGVTANSVGTVNQTVAPVINGPYLKTLQDKYFHGAQFDRQWQSLSADVTDKDIDGLGDKSAAWVAETYAWIFKNITPAAAERFVRLEPTSISFTITAGQYSEKSRKTYSFWRISFPQYLDNLDALMRYNAMYPQ